MSEIGVGLVGYKFMGRAHSNAYRQVARFFEVEPTPVMRVLCGRDEAAVREAADSLGWEGYETDYWRMLERDDVGLVDISSSGDTHHEFARAALEAGKHVLCEKPLANTLFEARELADAARRAGTVNMVCHNYRRVPAVQLARRLIDEGRLGEIRHWLAPRPRCPDDLASAQGDGGRGSPRGPGVAPRGPRALPGRTYIGGNGYRRDLHRGASPRRD
jgi:predicted dehydrogenase